jgi:NAD(P)-dependent dehydrogenase (short-subunit alcohol dehydrogenase family)
MAKPVAVVAGVGPGLSAALVRRFAAEGMAVAMAARNTGKLEGLADETGAVAHATDVGDRGAVDRLFAAVVRDLGVPELVVYNAGAYRPGTILDIDPKDFEACWRVGCLGGFHVGQAAARLMVEAGRGTILFTGATAALRGGARFVNLAVPKFGLRALAQSMARDLGPRKVHVAHVVIDGQIAGEREGYRESERGPDAVLHPDAIADTYWHLHRQHRSAWTQEVDLRPWVEKF